MNKTALITGITGQDGMYLAYFLLEKGYRVVGLVRRTSIPTQARLRVLHGSPNLHLVHGDVTDISSVQKAVREFRPDEFYHLAAQSHVAMSWEYPLATAEITGMGVLNCLEAIRQEKPDCRFYFAGSSEQFGNPIHDGKVAVLNETSPMEPESPYAAAKVFGYNITNVYRRSFDMFATCGILFNHECNDVESTIITRRGGRVNIEQIKDLVPNLDERTFFPKNVEIWDGTSWQSLDAVTLRRPSCEDHDIRVINTRHGVVRPTNHHNMLNAFNEKRRADSCEIDSELMHGNYPGSPHISTDLTEFEAEFIGLVVGDGWISRENTEIHISNIDDAVRDHINFLYSKFSDKSSYTGKKYVSGFGGESRRTYFKDGRWIQKWNLREECYNSDGKKRVPSFIINAPRHIQEAFLIGYNQADGLKSNKCTYKFKNFKTNSPVLAHGLLYLISNVTSQEWNVTYEDSKGTGEFYYSINLLSDRVSGIEKEEKVRSLLDAGESQRSICRKTGMSRGFVRQIAYGGHAAVVHHLSKPKNTIKKIVNEQSEWIADIQTSSGRFMAGVGTIVVANSPVRGEEFVTRKITSNLARVKWGLQEYVELGNMDACRDWGFAGDYVRAMHAMLQHDHPDDFVIATGSTYSVKEFFERCCDFFDLNPQEVYKVNPKYMRPKDVEVLLGDSSKARKELGWEPQCDFDELVEKMCTYDYYLQSPDPSYVRRADEHVL